MANDKEIPIYDIAKKLNISPAIVSRGLQDLPAIINDLSIEAGESAETIVKIKTIPDGVFVANDKCVVSCMMSIKRHGFPIPEVIAFADFNNDPVSLVIEPNLSIIEKK